MKSDQPNTLECSKQGAKQDVKQDAKKDAKKRAKTDANQEELGKHLSQLQKMSTEDRLKYAVEAFPGEVRFSTSLGPEDQVLTHMVSQAELDVQCFTLDTGRLFEETLALLEQTQIRLGVQIDVWYPDADELQKLVRKQGTNGFYESVENRKRCCYVRKVLPLNRALQGASVWITGIRRGQSQGRQDLPLLEWNEEHALWKMNPLLEWSTTDVQDYINHHNVPVNALHKKGFVSIGCAPCTRAIADGEEERAGRWWWESGKKECGLHVKQENAKFDFQRIDGQKIEGQKIEGHKIGGQKTKGSKRSQQ